MLRISEHLAARLGLIADKPSKYRSRRTTVDGIKFDSQREAQRYCDLLRLQRAGEVFKMQLQPEFILQEGYYQNGKWVRPIKYRADFQVWWTDGHMTVEDVKPGGTGGKFRTKEYRIKKKLFLARYPQIDFQEV